MKAVLVILLVANVAMAANDYMILSGISSLAAEKGLMMFISAFAAGWVGMALVK